MKMLTDAEFTALVEQYEATIAALKADNERLYERTNEALSRVHSYQVIAERHAGLHKSLEIELFGEVQPVRRDNGEDVTMRALEVIRDLKQRVADCIAYDSPVYGIGKLFSEEEKAASRLGIELKRNKRRRLARMKSHPEVFEVGDRVKVIRSIVRDDSLSDYTGEFGEVVAVFDESEQEYDKTGPLPYSVKMDKYPYPTNFSGKELELKYA
jgi:hypothetical protein